MPIKKKLSKLDMLKKEVEKEEEEIKEVLDNIDLLREKLLDKRPSHFSRRDIVNAFFGSLLIGTAFVLKGAVLKTVKMLSSYNIALIIIATSLILISQIYFISYSRIKDKANRNPLKFFAKRFVTLYLIAIIVSFLLIYVLGVYWMLDGFSEVMKCVVLMSMPSAIGAAIPNLLKKY